MFIDKVKIFIKSGNGGNGSASLHTEKYVPNGGPDGGDGGGTVVATGTPEEIAARADSYTGQFLAPILNKK